MQLRSYIRSYVGKNLDEQQSTAMAPTRISAAKVQEIGKGGLIDRRLGRFTYLLSIRADLYIPRYFDPLAGSSWHKVKDI